LVQGKKHCIVIGAGVAGLASALYLIQSGHNVTIIEKEAHIASKNSLSNSGVIHSGIYYPKSSLKSKHCTHGKKLLIQFAEQNNIPFELCGKYIVAREDRQIKKLKSLYENGLSVGLEEIQWLSEDELRKTELRHTSGINAIWVPSAGVISVKNYTKKLLDKVLKFGGRLLTETECKEIKLDQNKVTVCCQNNLSIEGDLLVNASGIKATQILSLMPKLPKNYSTKLGMGSYCFYNDEVPFNSLIYPVPEEHGLGIHITRSLDSDTKLGPNFSWAKSEQTELNENIIEDFYHDLCGLWQNIKKDSISSGFAGFRPKLHINNELYKDFLILQPEEHNSLAIHLLGIESPGLSASLSIGKEISQRFKQ